MTMAVKNSMKKEINANYNRVMEVLRNPKFAALIEADFLEEAKTSTCIEFRYVRKTSMMGYGRNYFIGVPEVEGDTTIVTVGTQSRKVTVLLDTYWKTAVNRVIKALEALV